MCDIGLYDSATGESLQSSKKHTITSGEEPIELLYCAAQRGPIVQVRRGCSRIHYFYREPEGQEMIQQDERRLGVSLADILENAPSD
jgi:hypothetical protein